MCDFQRRGKIGGFSSAGGKFLLLAGAKVSVLAGHFIDIVYEVALGLVFWGGGRGEDCGGHFQKQHIIYYRYDLPCWSVTICPLGQEKKTRPKKW